MIFTNENYARMWRDTCRWGGVTIDIETAFGVGSTFEMESYGEEYRMALRKVETDGHGNLRFHCEIMLGERCMGNTVVVESDFIEDGRNAYLFPATDCAVFPHRELFAPYAEEQ